MIMEELIKEIESIKLIIELCFGILCLLLGKAISDMLFK